MMHCNNSKGSRAASAGEFTALVAIVLALGLGLMARPAAAAPFAYVTSTDATVSVIDTATNTVVATVKAGLFQDPLLDLAVAVTPDGTLVYAVGIASSVIDAATNKVVYSNGQGNFDHGVAIGPGGQHANVTQPSSPPDVAVFATATNKFLAKIPVGGVMQDAFPVGVAVTPDGKHLYVTNGHFNNVLVIDTATDTVEAATIKVGKNSIGVAVTPTANTSMSRIRAPKMSR